MNAVDIAARGMAGRLVALTDATFDGSVNIDARDEPTAAALEALVEQYAVITGYAGATHIVDQAPWLQRDNLEIRGNRATLRNTNASDWVADNLINATLPLGSSNLLTTFSLTLDDISAIDGNQVTLAAAGAGSRYSPGDHFFCRGATEHVYMLDEDTYRIPRNVKRGVILDVAGDVLTLGCALPVELIADTPKIGTTAEGVEAWAGQTLYYLLRPRISDLTLTSDRGEAIKMGGIIGGIVRDLHIEAVNAMVLGAMERTLVENVSFLAHRKIAEISEGSNYAVYRNFHGSIVAGNGGLGPILMQIGENSADCVMERFNIDGGPDIGTSQVCCLIHSGRRNAMRDMTLDLRQQTGTLTALQALPTEGNPCDDSGFSDLTVLGGAPFMFFSLNDGGAGINRGYWRNVRFFGSPTATATGTTLKRAGWLRGAGTIYENLWCEQGAAEIDATASNITVRNCYFPDGFVGLTDTLHQTNNIHDNESDASRRLSAANKVVVGNTVQIASTDANNVWQSANYGAGDLAPTDRVFVYTESSAGGAGASNRIARLSITVNGTTTGIGSIVRSAAGSPMGYEAEITVLIDTGTMATLGYRIIAGGTTCFEGVLNVDSLVTHGLTVNMEYWCGNASDPVNTRSCRMIAVKRGMKHPALR